MSASRGNVLVTGSSTGIGRECALRLAREGFRVFAGVRREEDAVSLREAAGPALTPIFLDVTEAGSIAAAHAEVAAATGDGGLAGVVNNAGIVVAGPLELLPLEAFRRQLEVNLTGMLAVTQAFLPQVRAARGRIVNIGSISGRIAYPLEGPYSASKFAVEALSDSLRRELAQWGIRVALVNPGPVDTPIWEKSLASARALEEHLDPAGRELYQPLVEAVLREVRKSMENAVPAARVADAVVHALTAGRPRVRYWVGRGIGLAALAARLLPDRLWDALIARGLKVRPARDPLHAGD